MSCKTSFCTKGHFGYFAHPLIRPAYKHGRERILSSSEKSTGIGMHESCSKERDNERIYILISLPN